MKFEVGQRVRVYDTDYQKGFVEASVEMIDPVDGAIKCYGIPEFFHPKQVRRLRKKEKPKEEGRASGWISGLAPESPIGGYLLHSSPVGLGLPIKLVELRPGEIPVSREALAKAFVALDDKYGKSRTIVDLRGEAWFPEFCKSLGLEDSK